MSEDTISSIIQVFKRDFNGFDGDNTKLFENLVRIAQNMKRNGEIEEFNKLRDKIKNGEIEDLFKLRDDNRKKIIEKIIEMIIRGSTVTDP